MPEALSNAKEYQDIFHWAETQKDGAVPSFATRRNDPYEVNANPPDCQKTTAVLILF
jgi:homogentisate 1,2-dioxygenase